MILPTSYFPPIFYLTKVQAQEIVIEHFEHFIKQSFRNRCEIYAANGKLSLSIPLQKWKNHSIVKDIKISYDENWQAIHWKSIRSAYSSSPYFEFYEEELLPFFKTKKYNYLIDFNASCFSCLNDLMNLSCIIQASKNFEVVEERSDWRKIIHPKNKDLINKVNYPSYMQVFEEKQGFIPNLSSLDLLFNLGPQSKAYLKSIKHNENS